MRYSLGGILMTKKWNLQDAKNGKNLFLIIEISKISFHFILHFSIDCYSSITAIMGYQ